MDSQGVEPGELHRQRSRSFGSIADDYDRFRPGPSLEVVEWLVPVGAGTVVDLGAGTGALTGLLAGRFPRVVAVEPDDRMRAVLEAKDLGVEVLEGRGESVPLPDGVADAVVVSSAWHWMDPASALPEIARVLRPGGRFGVVWSGIDRAALGIEPGALRRVSTVLGLVDVDTDGTGEGGGGSPAEAVAGAPSRRGGHQLVLPADGPFEQPEHEVICWSRPMSVDDLVGNVGTYSRVILLPEAEQVSIAAGVRAYLEERYGAEGDDTIEVPFLARCWRAAKR